MTGPARLRISAGPGRAGPLRPKIFVGRAGPLRPEISASTGPKIYNPAGCYVPKQAYLVSKLGFFTNPEFRIVTSPFDRALFIYNENKTIRTKTREVKYANIFFSYEKFLN